MASLSLPPHLPPAAGTLASRPRAAGRPAECAAEARRPAVLFLRSASAHRQDAGGRPTAGSSLRQQPGGSSSTPRLAALGAPQAERRSGRQRRQLRARAAAAGVADAGAPGAASFPADDYFQPAGPGRKLRAICFYLTTLVIALPLFFVMLLLHPFVLLFDRSRRAAQHFVNRWWATATTALFYRVEIEGAERLPPPGAAAMYVANHQSFLDIYTLFLLRRSFKFISKTSNFLIPIIGWSMFLTGHVPLKRLDKRSQIECLRKCQDLLKEGVSVLFFPEGTRTKDGKMDAFKKGAFSIAAKARAPVVPIALIGTGRLMPNGMENSLRPGAVKVVVLPSIEGTDADDLCRRARAAIASTLMEHGLGVH